MYRLPHFDEATTAHLKKAQTNAFQLEDNLNTQLEGRARCPARPTVCTWNLNGPYILASHSSWRHGVSLFVMQLWEAVHKTMGYCTVALSGVTILLGMRQISPQGPSSVQALFIGWVLFAAVAFVLLETRRRRWTRTDAGTAGTVLASANSQREVTEAHLASDASSELTQALIRTPRSSLAHSGAAVLPLMLSPSDSINWKSPFDTCDGAFSPSSSSESRT